MSNDIIENEFTYRTFKDISYDMTNKRYLVNSLVKAVDFDNFVQNLEVNALRSVDALYINGGRIDLIEFKFTNVSDESKQLKILEKYKDTILVLHLRGYRNMKIKMDLVVSSQKNRNMLKRSRNVNYFYKAKLFYYVNFISYKQYRNILEIPFRIITEDTFDNKYR